MTVSEDVLAAMRATNDVFDAKVIRQEEIETLNDVYTSDARILPPGGEMIEGREQIKSFWQQAIRGLGITGVTLKTIEAEACGDSVVEIGRADLTLKAGQLLKAKYVVHWKQEEGRWKWHVDIWNTNQ